VKGKLGNDWTIDVDWAAIGKETEGSSYRENAGKNVIENYVVCLVDNDISKFDADAAAALNKVCGAGAKKITITMGPKTAEYKVSSRMNISIKAGGVTITWNADWFGYDHGVNYVQEALLAMPNATANPPIAGDWTLAEIKSVKAAQDKVDAALHKLRAKCGNDWSIDVDWASFATYSKGNSYRSDAGKYICGSLIGGFGDHDADKFDGDVAEALNGAVGTSRKVKFSLGPKDGKYETNSRLQIKVDKSTGVELQWSGDWFGYDYDSDYINQWVLKNC
jgi:hypothetical protein